MRDIFDRWMQSRVDTADIKAEDMKTFIIKDDGTIYNQKSDQDCGDIDLYASLMTNYTLTEFIEIILSTLNDSIEAEEEQMDGTKRKMATQAVQQQRSNQ